MPRGGVGHAVEVFDGADQNGQGEQQRGADRELQGRGRDRAADGRAELHVGGGLDGEQGADREEEGDGQGFHV